MGGPSQVCTAIEVLIELRADIHGKDAKGQTPLHIAATDAPKSIAERLCKLGASTLSFADVAQGIGEKAPPCSPPRSPSGFKPEDLARQAGRIQLAESLAKAAANGAT